MTASRKQLAIYDFDLGAHVWQGDRDGKVLVVIDDDAHFLRDFEMNGEIPVDARAGNGLYELANIAADNQAIRAIGFFEMYPSGNENERVLDLIATWLAQLAAGQEEVYFLIDVFHNAEGKPNPVGGEIMAMVRAKFPESHWVFLSKAGAAMSDFFSEQVGKVQAFAKSDFVGSYRAKTFPVDFGRWLGCDDDLERLVWPEETKSWFDGTESPVPHDLDNVSPERLSAAREAVRTYLARLLGVSPPEDWFADDQFVYLHRDLKGLVGVTSILQGEQNRPFSLGNAALLLAGITKGYALDSGGWISRVSWVDKAGRQLLPANQSREQAREAVAALVGIKRTGLFSGLKVNQDVREPLVRQVIFEKDRLRIVLDKNMQDPAASIDGRTPLVAKVQRMRCCDCEKGEVYKAYRDFLVAAGKTDRGVEPVCLTRCYCQGQATILEFVSVG